MDARTFIGWACRGIGGAINQVEMAIDDGATITQHFRDELRGHAKQINDLVDRLERENRVTE